MTEDVGGLLREAVADERLDGGAAGLAVRSAAHGRHVRLGVVSVSLVALAGVGLLTLRPEPAREALVPAVSPSPSPSPTPVVVDGVVHEGSRVRGTGIITSVPGSGSRFCARPSGSLGLVYVQPVAPQGGSSPLVTACSGGIRLDGVDAARIPGERDAAGGVEADLQVTGVVRGGVLHVEELAAPGTRTEAEAFPKVDARPVCPEPADGWPVSGPDNSDGSELGEDAHPVIAAYEADHPGAVRKAPLATDGYNFLRPAGSKVLLNVLVTDEVHRAPLQAQLDEVVGGAVCVQVARYSVAEVDQAVARFAAVADALQLSSYGTSGQPDGQPEVHVGAFMVTEELAEIAALAPPGLVRFVSTLQVIP